MAQIERAEIRDERLDNHAARLQDQRTPPLPALTTSQSLFISFSLTSTNRNEDAIQARSWVALDHSSDEDYVPSETEVTKRKQKGRIQTQPTILENAERCAGCIGKDIPCLVNMVQILKWEKDVAGGKVFSRMPAGVRCEECRTKRDACHLPRTKDLWATNDKRKQTVKEYARPQNKKQRVTASAEQVKQPSVTVPTWAADLEGLSRGLHIELQRSLNAHVKSSLAEKRIAIALNKLANRFVQDGSYLPQILSLAQSSFDEESDRQ